MNQSKITKRALLGSVLSMLLCLSMLVGSTFAWFTDSVSSGANKIVAGNLDIKLYYKNAADSDFSEVSAETNDLFVTKADESILWEPGTVAVTYLKIENAGSLALQYRLSLNFTDLEGENVDGNTVRLSEYLYYAFVPAEKEDGTLLNEDELTEQAQAAKVSSGLPAGRLSDVKKMSDFLYPKGATDENGEILNSEQTVALVIYMPQNSGNTISIGNSGTAPEISVGLNLDAGQSSRENDGFDSEYDYFAYYAAIIEQMEPGSTDTVTIDGVEFYVIAKNEDESQALLLSKYVLSERSFGEKNKWSDSSLRTYLNSAEEGGWLKNKPILAKAAVETEIITEVPEKSSNDTYMTKDKVFLLSAADVFGKTKNSTPVSDISIYTTGSQLEAMKKQEIKIAKFINGDGSERSCTWRLRSPGLWSYNDGVAGVAQDGTLGTTGNTIIGVRPALWVNLY